jgi:UDP-N-acetylglucosamine--N-acetylmuramyl-(pentapeptide) pyrophosphoryl-undecaprenol N-acetylglucosamine transferase
MKVVIAGGGTGGHIFPAVAIGHALQRMEPNTELLFVGANGKMEMEKIPQEGFKIIGLDIVGLNRSNWFKNILLPYKLWKSRQQANNIIKKFAPDAVVGVGGFASFPMLFAAQAKGIPTLIQEQNSYAGKSNKILGKKAKAICVAYGNMSAFFPTEKIIQTGNPVRASIAKSTVSKEAGLKAFHLAADKKTLLVVGGSLGAKTINEAMLSTIQALVEKENIQVIWQTGKHYVDIAQATTQALNGVVVKDFIRNMEYAYAAADIVISRAGALAIAELCILGKPVIFVPYPYAAEDHQTSNAMALVKEGAAMMVKDSDAKNQLIVKLKALLADKALQQIMANNLTHLAITDADERIAHKVIEISGK